MSEPLYQKIYDSLKYNIENGHYRPGDQVPTETALAQTFQVSIITSKRALNMLAEDGYLIRQKGRGSFVSGDIPAHSTSAEPDREITPLQESGPVSVQETSIPQLPRIGLIYPTINTHFGITAVSTIADSCLGKAHLLLALSHDNTKLEEAAIQDMTTAPVDGLIVFPGSSQFLNPRLLQMVIDQYPLVFIDQNIQAIRQTSVGTDNTEAVFQALRYITGHGHTQLSVMHPTISNNVLQERLDAVFQYSATTGFSLNQDLWLTDVDLPADDIVEADIERIARHLAAHPEITVVFAFHYTIAVAVKRAAARIGRHIGQDLAVLCFDSPHSLLETPYFTNIRQDEAAISRKAVELLLNLIQNPGLPPQNIRIPAELVEGESFFTIK